MVSRRDAVVAVFIAGAVAVMAVALYEVARPPLGPPTCSTAVMRLPQPIGSSLAIGASRDTVRGTDHWYNFTLESVGACITLGAFVFEVRSPTGATQVFPSGSGVSVVSLHNVTEADYLFGEGWSYSPSFSATSALSTSDFLSLFYNASSPASLVGYSLVATGADGTTSGTVT